MASWGIITINGVQYDCTHLDTFVMPVTPKAEGAATRRVLVTFGHHCFTRKIRPGDPPEATVHHRGHDNDPRCFCPIRHGHSLNLRSIIEGARDGQAFFGEEKPWRPQNYLLIDAIPGINSPYAVYFDLKKSNSKNVDVAMLINSAHPKPNMPAKMDGLPFRVMVATIAAGRAITRPKK